MFPIRNARALLAAFSVLVLAVSSALGQSAPAAKDANLLIQQGRALVDSGKRAEGYALFEEAVAVCDAELAENPARMDSYVVKGWALFRLGRYREAVAVGEAGLKVKFDARIVENMGESYFFLRDYAASLRSMQRYIDNSGEYAERVSTAYFYMGEIYQVQRKFEHADIAYAIAVQREPNMARWWFRYGNAVEALGEKERARGLYEKALKLAPSFAEARDALARLSAAPAAPAAPAAAP
ncbi:MAG: tetratricopeptide repeat protein [Spirochaetia bacterium]|nr:tetratricopeptide repeat protein [Spirochaetia bacterium]